MSKNILMVDDEASDIQPMKEILEKNNYEVTSINNGKNIREG